MLINDPIASLVVRGCLLCPRCRARDIWVSEIGLVCKSCGQDYDNKDGVYDLLLNAPPSVEPADRSNAIAQALANRYGLSSDPKTLARLREIIVGSQVSVGNTILDAEIQSFTERFQIFNIDCVAEFIAHYIGSVMPAGANIHRTVRLRNIGEHTWSSRVGNPVYLSYHWLLDDRIEIFEGARTPLPCEVAPGRAVSVPMNIVVPSHPGRYKLRIMLVHEGIRWVEDSCLDIPVEVSGQIGVQHPFHLNDTKIEFSQDEDQNLANAILAKFVDENFVGQIELLEIGGGLSPQTTALFGNTHKAQPRVINIDVSMSLLQMGVLLFEQRKDIYPERLTFACCDATFLPFTTGLFDGIILFRVLHHFEALVPLLRECHRSLQDGGFVALMCEPVGNQYDQYTIDLIKSGVNEQIFSLEEYSEIIRQSGFEVIRGEVDWGFSLKALLRKSQEG